MSEWQPIESAPKDGTAVWLLVGGHPFLGYCEPADARFDREEMWFLKASFRRAEGRADDIFGCYAHDAEPTHWMPLPDPPA